MKKQASREQQISAENKRRSEQSLGAPIRQAAQDPAEHRADDTLLTVDQDKSELSQNSSSKL